MRCLFFVVYCCVLFDVCCLMFVGCCLSYVDWRVLIVGVCLFALAVVVVCVVRRLVFVA